MKFSRLAKYIQKIESTSSRLTITEHLAALFKDLDKNEIKNTTYLLQGRVAPLYEATEFGMAEKMVKKAICRALNLESKLFDTHYKKIGDLGKTVEEFKKEIKSLEEKDLSVQEVFEILLKLATASGAGSQDVKINQLAHLVRNLDSLSCRYLVRIPLGVMRLGFSDMTVLDALSWTIKGDKSFRLVIEKAYHVRPDLGYIAELVKKKGIGNLNKVMPAVFTPILMMRAERLPSGKEIIEKIGKCAIEPKYDGFRLQIHYSKKNKNVKLYSRNLEDVTFMYPDIVFGVQKEVKADEIIIEGEAIGFDPVAANFLPFQETVQRKRKYDIEKMTKEVPLKLFAFELLFKDAKSYIDVPYIERKRTLEKCLRLTGDIAKDTVLVAKETITDDTKKLELLFDDALSRGLEGIIAKKLDGIYQAGARGWNWIKFKRSYSTKIEDTIDCLIMGYDLGKGKRAGFGIGAFLVGVFDEHKDKYVTVAKIGTGLTDEEWKTLKAQSSKLKVQNKPNQYEVDKAMECDVWLTPHTVVEIKADEITRSPVHTAGRKLKPSRSGSALDVDVPGFALRFPRLQRFREDKRAEDITSLKEVERMFKDQFKRS